MMFYNLVLAIVASLPGPGKTQATQPELLCLNPSKLYPDNENCRRFIRCVNRKPVSFSCPPKTAFDPVTQTCIWRLHVGDCNQEKTTYVWATPTTTTGAQLKQSVKNEASSSSPIDEMIETNHLGAHFLDAVSVDKKSPDSISDFDKILLDIQKQNGNSNLQSTISSSASKSKVKKNENANMHNLDQSESQDLTHSSSITIPVSSDNSRYAVNEDTTQGDNSKYTLNEVSTSLDSLTQSHDSSGTERPTVNLQQKTAHDQTAVETNQQQTTVETNQQQTAVETNPDDSEGSKQATTHQVILGMVDGRSKFTPTWLTRMNDGKITTTESPNSDDNLMSTSDTVTLTSASMDTKEVIQLEETTTIYSLGVPKVANSMAETSTTAEITSDNNIKSYNDEQDEKNINSGKVTDSVVVLTAEMNEQQVERDSVSQEGHTDLHGVRFPQNRSEVADTTEDGFTEDNITSIIMPFSAFTSLQLNKDQEVMAHQHLDHAKEFSQELAPLEKDDLYRASFKSRTYTHPEDSDVNTNHDTLLLQTSKHVNDSTNIVSKTVDVRKNEESTNSARQLSKSDLFTVAKDMEIRTELYNKQMFEVAHNTSSSTNITSKATPSSDNLQVEKRSQDKFNFKVKSSEENIEKVPVSKLTVTAPVQTGNSKSTNSADLNSNFDFSTLTSRRSSSNRTHVTAAAGMTHKDELSNSSTTLLPPQTEGKLNASFMSVPYMIRGLVRPFRCPQLNGHFIDPKNCSVYYHCAGGQAYRRDCPAGQVFHLAALSCVSSSLAPPCPKTDNLQEEDDDVERQFQCEADGYFRDAKQCNVYYVCAAGNSMRMTCDPGTSFDVTNNLCLWNSEVHDCNKSQSVLRNEASVDSPAVKKAQKESIKLQTPIAESGLYFTDYKCPERNGVFPDFNNCSIYHVCNNGMAKHMVCPRGAGYDVMLETCVDSSRVDRCMLGNGYDVKSYETVASLPLAQFVCPESHGLYSDVNNCSVFIHCFKKIPYRHICQADTVFSPEIGVCTWRELVPECQTAASKLGQDETKIKNILTSQGQLMIPDVLPEPYKQLLPNPESPENDQQEQAVGVQDFVCPDVADGFFRDNLFCDIFHRCVLGTRFTFTCPSGTFFRLRGNLCDFWESVSDCTQDGLRVDAVRSLPEIATLPVPQPIPNELDLGAVSLDADPVPCPESSGLFAHPRNCRQFLFCAQFIPLVLTCPESLLYNPLTLTCDLSKNVQCLRYDDYKIL